MHPDVVLPNEPEFCLSDNFPGNLRPSPVWAKSVDPEAVRSTLNFYRDNFDQQRRYNREMKAELLKSHRQEKLLWRGIVLLVLAVVAVLVIALVR